MSRKSTRSAVALVLKARIEKGSRHIGHHDIRRPGFVYLFVVNNKRMSSSYRDGITESKIRKSFNIGDQLTCKLRKKPSFKEGRVYITQDILGKFDISYIRQLDNGLLLKSYQNPHYQNDTVAPDFIKTYYEVLLQVRDC